MSAAEWPRSLRPDQRDPVRWNPARDGLAHLYRLMQPGDRFAGMSVTVINGNTTTRLVLDRDGARRVVVSSGEDEAGAA